MACTSPSRVTDWLVVVMMTLRTVYAFFVFTSNENGCPPFKWMPVLILLSITLPYESTAGVDVNVGFNELISLSKSSATG